MTDIMKDPRVLYGALALGVIALAVGAYLVMATGHHKSGYAGLVVGVILLIVGVAGMVMKPKSGTAAR